MSPETAEYLHSLMVNSFATPSSSEALFTWIGFHRYDVHGDKPLHEFKRFLIDWAAALPKDI